MKDGIKVATCAAVVVLLVLLIAAPAVAETDTYGGPVLLYDYTDSTRHCGFSLSALSTDVDFGVPGWHHANLWSSTLLANTGGSCEYPDYGFSSGYLSASADMYYWSGGVWNWCANTGAGFNGTDYPYDVSEAYKDSAIAAPVCGHDLYYMAEGWHWIGTYTDYPSAPVTVSPWAYYP
jgi:hypothetical protein